MTLPETDVARVRRWCGERSPAALRDELRIECEVADRHVTIVERRPPWHADLGPEWTDTPVARLRYTQARREWTLYWPDRNTRWHRLEEEPSAASIDTLLEAIDRDDIAIFWG